jgi:hypothetical protein
MMERINARQRRLIIEAGRIAREEQARLEAEYGSVVLEGLDRRHLGSQVVLREGDDALTVARRMLKKSLDTNSDFTRAIRYPPGGYV